MRPEVDSVGGMNDEVTPSVDLREVYDSHAGLCVFSLIRHESGCQMHGVHRG
jgi:hypothetical protein